ncbi:MAG TPA: hypothetical protein VFC50_02695 [Candidatus Dormibacteraeota bacterium]|nr:hypothetical protein [Candidatus Dormibacteraeota bacterium]
MEESQPPLTPEAEKPVQAGPIMDVVAPPPAEPADGSAPGTPPVTDPSTPAPAAPPAHQKAPPQAKKPRAAGVNAAIFATVVIVLGLAVLAVYAYTKQK